MSEPAVLLVALQCAEAFDQVQVAVIRKLLWFREGGEVSTTQWRDVVQNLRLAAGTLDGAYLQEWAGRLRTQDLLDRAMRDAG